MVHKLVFVGVALAFGLLAFLFSIIGLCTNQWRTSDGSSLGLWKVCQSDSCSDLQIGQNRAYFAFEIVRGFGILAVITAFGGLVVSVLTVGARNLKIGPSVLATFFLMSAGFGIICASVFTSLNHTTTSNWGYSFAFVWLAAPLALIAGVVSAVQALRSD